MRVHPSACGFGQRGAWGPSFDHQFGRKLRRSQSHCSRGLVVKIVRYKNIELTLTTRQLHSRELYAAGALRTARPTQSKVRVSPTSHTFLLHEHGAVTHRAASGVAFVRVLSPVEQRRVADEEKAGQENPRMRDHESKFQVVKLVGGSTNGMPRSMACSSEQEPNLVNTRLTTPRRFRSQRPQKPYTCPCSAITLHWSITPLQQASRPPRNPLTLTPRCRSARPSTL